MLSMILGPLAERLVPILQTPVEDIIYEVLDQKGLPTRAEVRELRNKLDRLEKTLLDLNAALDGLRGTVEAVAAKADAAQQRAAQIGVGPAQAPSPTRVAVQAPAAPELHEELESRDHKLCKVDDCDKGVRAKGFCAAHYQRFKRGTLVGWVGDDGATVHEEVRYMVGADYAGQPVQTFYEGDDVHFFLPESGGLRLELKVNDARID